MNGVLFRGQVLWTDEFELETVVIGLYKGIHAQDWMAGDVFKASQSPPQMIGYGDDFQSA
jgi:hypothetical protein